MILLQASISQMAAGLAIRGLADFHSDIGLAMTVHWNGISTVACGSMARGAKLRLIDPGTLKALGHTPLPRPPSR